MINIETLTSLTKLLFDGLVVVVFLYIYIKMLQNDKKDRKEEKERYNKMVDDIITGVHNIHLTPDESQRVAKIDTQINDSLNVILKETGASRVSIIRYHNGSKDMTGKSFLKMSVTNEALNIGVASMMSSFKDIFRSFLAYWCHEISEKGYCSIDNIENIKDKDVSLYQYFKAINVQSSHAVALRDTNNNVIGILHLEFLDKDNFDIGKIEKSLDKNFSKIETLISVGGELSNE